MSLAIWLSGRAWRDTKQWEQAFWGAKMGCPSRIRAWRSGWRGFTIVARYDGHYSGRFHVRRNAIALVSILLLTEQYCTRFLEHVDT